ncbi:MAG: cytochrome c [Acidobacteria bacterium]|nr:cytochrome c [Acidobacteriota bacterium]
MAAGASWRRVVPVLLIAGVAALALVQAQTPAPRPASTVAQLMQAVLFPNANVIFVAEGEDPAAMPRDARPAASTNPLTGLYGGWQAVENSGLALMESADLLDMRGRLCANGTAVPVDEDDWTAAVRDLREAAGAVAVAARTQNQERIGETAITLADSCSTCHRIYRRPDAHCAR